jgi:hypothetical protein
MAASEEPPLRYQVRAASESPDLLISFQVYSVAGVSDAWLFCSACCQTLALKVSIHCEGCKKKVKKVLHSVEGKEGEETLSVFVSE